MKNREQINEALLTGVRALDLLTPVGRGASLLVIGPNGAGKSTLAEDAVLGQRDAGERAAAAAAVNEKSTRGLGAATRSRVRSALAQESSGRRAACLPPALPVVARRSIVCVRRVRGWGPAAGVHCVFASTTRTAEELRALEQRLAAAGVLANTCVVAAEPSAPLGEKYAALCAAYTVGGARAPLATRTCMQRTASDSALALLPEAWRRKLPKAVVTRLLRCGCARACRDGAGPRGALPGGGGRHGLAVPGVGHARHHRAQRPWAGRGEWPPRPVAPPSWLARAPPTSGLDAHSHPTRPRSLACAASHRRAVLPRCLHLQAREGLIKDANGRDLSLPAPGSEAELVDYEGMLVSGAVAQRRA